MAEMRPVHEAFAWFRSHSRELEDLQMEVTAIPAPPWGEAARSEWLRLRFEELGLATCIRTNWATSSASGRATDPDAPYIALSAHIDTVFPAGTEIAVRREAGKLYGPGISDNCSGIVATAGNCRRHARRVDREHRAPAVYRQRRRRGRRRPARHAAHLSAAPLARSIGTLIAIDGAGTDTIIAEGLGSRRYEVTVVGTADIPGATSAWPIPSSRWRASSIASPARRFRLRPRPRSTSAPSTAALRSTPFRRSATMRVDTRSASVEELDRLERALHEAVDQVIPATPGRKKQGDC